MVFVRAVREVHANNVEAGPAQGIDLLGGVGLGANGADDRGAAVLFGGAVLRVELREPLNARAAGVQVVKSVGHGVGRSVRV